MVVGGVRASFCGLFLPVEKSGSVQDISPTTLIFLMSPKLGLRWSFPVKVEFNSLLLDADFMRHAIPKHLSKSKYNVKRACITFFNVTSLQTSSLTTLFF